MKFVIVSHVLPPAWSGQAVMIGRILKNVPPAQYCLISTENYQNAQDGNTGSLPGKYYVLPKEPGFLRVGTGHWTVDWLCAFFRGMNIARIVRREKCDIVVAASGNLIDIPAGWWASVLAGARFVPYLFDDYVYQWPDKTTRAIAYKMEERVYGRVSSVIVPNEFMRDEIQKRHTVKAILVRNPCENTPEKVAKTFPTNYGPQAEIRIVYTGAIYHVNFEAFRNLIAATDQTAANVKIHLYTAQPREWLEQNGVKGKQIVLHSHSVHTEVVKAQNQAHILFLPFSFNSTVPEVVRTSAPGKLGEYLTSGVPILVHVPSDTFVSWYFRKYECGYVVDTNDILALKTAFETLLNDAVLRRTLVTNAQERAGIDFDPVVASWAFMGVMESVL
ncbi:MAG: glycosyltransferase [Chloroflexota bacterium]